MSRTRKTVAIILGTIVILIVLFFIVLATFDWNRLKPTINQKVSAELNRPFAIRGDLGVVWERQPGESGWRSWIPWPHVHADDIILGNPPDIPDVTIYLYVFIYETSIKSRIEFYLLMSVPFLLYLLGSYHSLSYGFGRFIIPVVK